MVVAMSATKACCFVYGRSAGLGWTGPFCAKTSAGCTKWFAIEDDPCPGQCYQGICGRRGCDSALECTLRGNCVGKCAAALSMAREIADQCRQGPCETDCSACTTCFPSPGNPCREC